MIKNRNEIPETKRYRKYFYDKLTGIALMIIFVSLIILLEKSVDFHENKDYAQNDYLTVWYNDAGFDNYFNVMAEEYEAFKGIKVKAVYISDIDYFNSINKAEHRADDTVEEAPDVYLINAEELEEAFGYGLAEENKYDDYSEENFPQSAINAVKYKDKLIAYPLCFDTVFMIYNPALFNESPRTFDEILKLESQFDWEANPSVRHILYWNIADITHNYGFVGKYAVAGGKSGDDRENIDLNNENVINAFAYYSGFSDVLNIKLTDNFDVIPSAFSKGNVACTIINMHEYNKITADENMSIEYKICEVPDMTETMETSQLSNTKVLAVNYMSDKIQLAEEFARYTTYEQTEKVYELTGYLPAKKTEYENEDFNVIMSQYEKSVNLPKLMMMEDYYLKMESVFNKAWKKENITDNLESIQYEYMERLN